MNARAPDSGRRVLRILLWLGAGFVVAVLLAVTWLWNADLGFVEPKIEKFVTELTGRRFEIEGGLTIDVGERVVIVVRDVHWQNADWDESADMLRVGYAEVRVDPWSLFRRLKLAESMPSTNRFGS